MTLDRLTPYNLIEIWMPRYKDRTVLVAKYKVGLHNKIVFTKAKHLMGKEYYISGKDIEQYPITDNGKLACYQIPLDDLKVLELTRKEY